MEEPLIISDPTVMVEKPIIKETRITVEQILAEYPHLTHQGVVVALHFAAESVRTNIIYSLGQASA